MVTAHADAAQLPHAPHNLAAAWALVHKVSNQDKHVPPLLKPTRLEEEIEFLGAAVHVPDHDGARPLLCCPPHPAFQLTVKQFPESRMHPLWEPRAVITLLRGERRPLAKQLMREAARGCSGSRWGSSRLGSCSRSRRPCLWSAEKKVRGRPRLRSESQNTGWFWAGGNVEHCTVTTSHHDYSAKFPILQRGNDTRTRTLERNRARNLTVFRWSSGRGTATLSRHAPARLSEWSKRAPLIRPLAVAAEPSSFFA
mmetsp:Transcript_16614/g.38753  ORF Transcript_16614/g.38753 Transcript_16614/m.38753 type:complete len:254 (+) Transcript_16614:561-1322(+)